MPEVQRVIVTLRNPVRGVAGDAGEITFGYFVVEGDRLTMTDGAGTPMRRPSNGELYTHKLEPGEDPRRVAGRMTRTIRSAVRVYDLGGFNRPIVYAKAGLA